MRQTLGQENNRKTGDYVVDYEIENEMEKDRWKFDWDFLEKQYELELKKQSWLYELAYEKELQEEYELESKSHICPGSLKIMSGYDRGNVHLWLHELSKEQIWRQKATELCQGADPEATHKPQI